MNKKISTFDNKILNNSELDRTIVAYGRKTYAELLKQCANKAIAVEALKAVLLDMYTSMEAIGSADPLEAMMFSQGRKYQTEYLEDTVGAELNQIIKDIVSRDADESPVVSVPPAKSTVSSARATESKKPEIIQSAPIEAEHIESAPAQIEIKQEHTQKPAAAEPHAQMPQKTDSRKKSGFWINFLIFLLVLCIITALWVVIGLAMSTGLIPEFDLGYEWFNRNITWFF